MFDLRSKSSRFVALALTAVTALSALTFMPAAPAKAAVVNSSDGLCTATVDVGYLVTTYNSGDYCYIAFKNAGQTYNWTPQPGVSKADVLIVAGGGGGGSRHAGGGGAGGLVQLTGTTISGSPVSIVVGLGGAGGPGGTSSYGAGTNGGNSAFASNTAIGGGAGTQGGNGNSGGSGGGGGNNATASSTFTSGQGNSGGIGNYSSPWSGGGGGGAGAAGTNSTSSVTGAGGNGLAITWITTAAATALGVGQISSSSVYFAGGGSGGGTSGSGMTVGAAGLGGGGAGQYNNSLDGVAGTPNTGGGGGGSGQNGGWGNGGAGGSGVVVVRYPAPQQILSYNASDINSYDSSVGTAVNDLSTGGTYDGTLTAGSNSSVATYNSTTGAWSFPGGVNQSGPYVNIGSNISSNAFAQSGMTIDFEANFGSQADYWERVFEVGDGGGNSVLIQRVAQTNTLALEVYDSGSSEGYCQLDNAIPTSGNSMARWTISIDGVKCKIWKDGNASASVDAAYAGLPAAGKTWNANIIGKSFWSGGNSFEGSVRSVRVYSGALTPAQIGAFSSKTVTYSSNGSGAANTSALTSGALRLPAALTRPGYTFGGWNTLVNGQGTNNSALASYTPTADITLYAKWTANTYTVTYDYNGATGNNFTGSNTFTTGGSAINLPNPTKSGYKFSGWYSDAGLNTFVANGATTYSPSGSTPAITLYAKWTLASLVLSYNASDLNHYNSASGSTVNDLSPGGTYDATFSNHTSSTFDATSGSWTFGGGSRGTGQALLLPSISSTGFATNGMTIDFEADFGPTESTTDRIFDLGVNGSDTNNVAIWRKAGTTDLYLTVMNDSTGTNVVSHCFATGAVPATSTMARWTISIDGTTCRMWKNGTSVVSTAFTAKPRTGQLWATNYIGRSNWVTDVDFKGSIRSLRVLQGAYTPDEVGEFNYKTVSFDTNAGSSSIGSTRYTSGSAKLAPAPTRTGYTFTNWYSDAGATTLVGAAGATYTPTANTTLYAGWTAAQYTITYKANNGGSTADITQTVTDGVSVALRSNTFTKANSTFTRWSDVANALSINSWTNGQTITPTGNLTLYAVWADDATITFDSNGGSAVSTVLHQPYSAIPNTYVGLAKPSNPTKSGKLFGGWATSETSNNGDLESLVGWPRQYESASNSETLYAIWLDACVATPTTFVGTGKTNAASATYGETGKTYLRYRFNTVGSCAWIVPAEVTSIDTVLVGGGGAGSYYNRAGGGGAGALLHTDASGQTVTAGEVIPIQVGAGGSFTFSSSNGSRGTNGSATILGSFVANGGGAGAGGIGPAQVALLGGGSSGGAACGTGFQDAGISSVRNYSGWSGFVNNGGTTNGRVCDTSGGAGGGGAGGSGANAGAGGASLTKFGVELAGGGAGWAASGTLAGGGTVGGDYINGCPASPAGANDGVANTGSGGASCGQGASGTIILQYIAPTYTATYDYDSATGGNSPASANYTMAGTALTLPSPTRTGYTFDGWHIDSALTTWIGGAGASYTPSSDVTLYAKWTVAASKTVTFDANGGSGSMTSQVTNVATALTANTFTRSGYSFAGWATTANGTVAYADGASFAFTADTTLYAKWTALPNKTVTFDANNGSGTMAAQVTNVATNLTANAFNRDGYTFAGWNTAANGSGTPYANNASYAFTANTTLYAQWTAVNYTITYNSPSSTSGSVPTDSANYNIGRSVAILGNSGSLVRTGYTFAGWTVASDGSGTVLVSGSTLTFSSANINVYAKWTANTYTISYNVNGATGAQANTSDTYTTAGTAVTLSAVGTMQKAGHTFNGWAASASGTPIAGTYTTTANVTLYAQWTINTITVTYDKGSAGGTSLSSHGFTNFPTSAGTGNYGTRLNLSNSIDGTITVGSDVYTFVGWNDGTSIYATGTSFLLQSDVTMTAVWALTHAVRYTFNGGTAANGTSSVDTECGLANSRCTDQQGITLNVAPTRDGYTFAGWRDQSGADFAAGSNVTVTSTSYLFYAQWTAIPYTVTYLPNGGASTPTEASKNIGDRFTVANAVNRTGYTFGGWFDGAVTYGPGATYVVGTANVSFTAQWIANVYTINYDWNGGSGSALADGSYTVGTTGITLPSVTDQVKDGYTFGGWATSIGGVAVSSPFVPAADATLYAIWGSGSYSITYAPELGTVATTTVTVANGNSINLETPTRQGFVFDGWFTAQTGGTRVGGGNSSFTPAASRTLHARWTQASIYGIPVGNLSRLGSLNASGSANSTYSGSNANSSVSVNVPSGALPTGTQVNIDMISDNTHASGLINGNKSFILSVAVSWLAGDGTVPDTASGKSISVTLNNSGIKAGALIYSIQGTSVVLLGTATQDGTVTFELTQDPGIYVVATSPTAPQNASSTTTSNSATISWQAPSSDGGDAITGYTVTLNSGATCTTTGALSCTISGLNAGTTYTYTVTATNSVGTSPTTSGSFSITANQTVVFDANGGSGSMSSQASNTSGSLNVNTFTRSGYAFTGWNTAANGSGTPYADGANYAFTAGATLYAQWSASTYTVTYNYNSATNQNGPSSAGFTSGGSAVTLPSPTKIGYSFDGWFTDAGLSTLLGAGGFSYSPSASITLYAGWTVLPNQTVIFDANGGTGTMSNQVTNVATALTSNAFTKSGYTFAGWNTAANGSGTSYADGASYPFTAGATLYAQWALIPVAPPVVTPPTPQYERPDAPTNVTAAVVAGGDSITVSWSAPTFTGGTAIVNYRVTSSSGMACITTDTSCTFNGVNKDVSYSFTVTSNNGYRDSLPSSASNAVLIPSQLKNQAPISAAGSQTARGAAVKVVVAGGSTNGPIIYDVANGTATGCSIDGEGWLTATTSGTCLVTVTMLGDFTYKPVTASTSITFLCKLIAQAPLAITSSGSTSVTLGTTGGSGSGAVSYSVTDGTANCVLTGNIVTAAKTGTCVVTATKAADDVYEATTSPSITVSVTVTKPIIVTPPQIIKVDPVKHVVAVAPTGKPVLVGTPISKPIIFGPDSAKLDSGDLKQLKAVAIYVKAKKLSVLVTGFAKSAGKSSFIEKLLATSRAKAVATYLRKLGVNVAISYTGYGAYNKTSPSANDRRVEVRVIENDQ